MRLMQHLQKLRYLALGRLTRQSRTVYTLTGSAVVLSGGIMLELCLIGGLGRADVGEPKISPEARVASVSISAAQPVERWESVALARPLFSSSRSPAVVLAQDLAPSQPPPRLSAILMIANQKIGIFYLAKGAPVIVRAGSSLGAFKVLSIAMNTVQLSSPAGIETLRIDDGGSYMPNVAVASLANSDDIADFRGSNSWPVQ
jgi:hypothetical protein